jgi:hypothetical protein
MYPKETPLFEIHKTNSFVKLYPSGIEVANTSESITYLQLSHIEMIEFANGILEHVNRALVHSAIVELKKTKPAELKGLHALFDMLSVENISNIYYGKMDAFISNGTRKVIAEVINEQISIIKEREKE